MALSNTASVSDGDNLLRLASIQERGVNTLNYAKVVQQPQRRSRGTWT